MSNADENGCMLDAIGNEKKQDSVFFVGPPLGNSILGGRELLGFAMLQLLKLGSKREVHSVSFERIAVLNLRGFLLGFFGYINGLSRSRILGIQLELVREPKAVVFLNGSNFGELFRALSSNRVPAQKVTFFHNVEARFFLGLFLSAPSFRSLGILIVNFLAERKAVKYSDTLIALSRRDSEVLGRLYGRCADYIFPLVIKDHSQSNASQDFFHTPNQLFLLFVGGSFYGNRDGVLWYVKNVAPRVNLPLYIVGNGFEELRSKLEVPGRVHVIGRVEHLAPWYRRALAVVAPIWDGSGMKTKVAEALMFGKKVIGTPEAFAGYEDALPDAGWICKSVDDFKGAIDKVQRCPPLSFDPILRSLYEAHYSEEAGARRMSVILAEIEQRAKSVGR